MANRRLSKEIRTIHHEVNGIYGHRRIKAELTAMGHACGRHRVARLMREAGLRVRSRKRWRLVSSSRHALPIAPNHLDRQFASDRANRHWVSDMTYVRVDSTGRCNTFDRGGVYGATCRVDAGVDGARGNALARCPVTSPRDRAAILGTDRNRDHKRKGGRGY
ncbi:IS3 family transposase [Pseudomonas aeruginosa]|uniref:IS3 family transposase n=1 Tax=Pseudomonas aeruginosa TaxID=287 RepID=UPI0034A0919B